MAAGIVAAGAMDGFQRLWLKAWPAHNWVRPRTDVEVMKKIANRAARKTGCKPSKREREFLAYLLHYGFGATAGAIYALLAQRSSTVNAGFGSFFGTLFFASTDAFAPQRLKPKVQDNEAISQVYEWLTHVVYGVALEAGRRGANQLLKNAA